MKLHRVLAGLFLLVLTAFPGLADDLAAQAPSGVVTGNVVDDGGAPLPGLAVRLRGPVERETVADASGRYRFVGLPAGAYTLQVESFGYTSAPEQVRVGQGTLVVDLVAESDALTLAPLQVVTTTRAGKLPTTLPIKVDVIETEQVRRQQSLVTNPTELLANLVPSYSPGRQKLTSSGESFRGRRPLFLVDGVPQSNPLRDGRRDGFTIGLEEIERVEVVFGANAIQGLGATGGIVNYITVSPPESGALEQRLSLTGTGSDGLEGDGFGWRAHYMAGRRIGEVDVLGSFGYERRGLQFDGAGRPVGIDNVQGDVADSGSRSFFAKVGWEPDDAQRLQITASDFLLEQRGSFESVPGDRAAGVPATSVEGEPEGVEPMNDVTMVALDYEHAAALGGTLSAKVYAQDFRALFGGGRFDTFQDPAIAPVGEVFDQSENNSRKVGTRLTYAGLRVAGSPFDVVAGFDFLRDETFQRLVHTDRNWVPVTRFKNYAPFVQLDLDAGSLLTLSGGLRWELAELDVPGFTTLAGNRADFQPVEVAGGSPSFDEPLLNVGAVVTPVPGLRFYGTLSQAFTMPDVGRVLRGITEEGTAVEDFLDLQPVTTDNAEVGGAFGTERSHVGVTYFRSSSDFGSRLVPNADGIFRVFRQPTLTYGWELTGRFDPTDRLSLVGGYSDLEGRFDGDADGEYEADLGATDVGPDRLTLSLDAELTEALSGRVQTFHFFDRDFEDAAGAPAARFDGYTTTDVSLAFAHGRSTLTLAVSNLLDAQYITYYSQAGTDLDDRYFAGLGRTFTVRIESRF